MILGTAGHIDHGKTALVRALTGVNTDRLPEEKKRGITIDLGFAPLEMENGETIGIVDVPGHEAFIRTMLAGASGIDMAMLVIAADEGVMPQTREHLEILSLLGITHGVVALTKCDLVDDDWLELQKEEIAALISAGSFQPVEIVAVSARTGAGLRELRSAISVASRMVSARGPDDDLFRMPIDRAFTVKGTGTVVTGTVWSGHVDRDSAVIIHPGSRQVRVRGIEHHGHSAGMARGGERTALSLGGVDLDDVERGSVLVADTAWTATQEIDAIVELTQERLRITPRTKMRLHVGTSETDARMTASSIDIVASRKNVTRARIHLAGPLLVRGGDRFVLRLPSPARTIGGGLVIDPYPPPRRRGKQRSPVHAGADLIGPWSPAANIEAMVAAGGARGVSLSTLPIRAGVTATVVTRVLDANGSSILGDRVFGRDVMTSVRTEIENRIRSEAANHPLAGGVSIQAIRAASDATGELVDRVLDLLVVDTKIERSGSVVRPFGWKPQLAARVQALSDTILNEICKQPSEPPAVSELAAKFGGSTLGLLRKLERDGKLKRVSDDRYYSSDAVDGIVGMMRSQLEKGRAYEPSELREVLGVSRKYLIPFLEFCDRSGVTERRQNGRIMR